MENTRKNELEGFLEYITEDYLVGIYYLDKTLNIPHYSVYEYKDLNILRDKLKSFGSSLEDSLIKIITWRSSNSKDYLIGVYDGIMNEYENNSECEYE